MASTDGTNVSFEQHNLCGIDLVLVSGSATDACEIAPSHVLPCGRKFTGNQDYRRYPWGLVEDLVLPFFGDQLLEMVHDLVAPSHDRLNF